MGKFFIPVLLILALTCSCVKKNVPVADDSLPDQVKSISVLPVTSLTDTDNVSVRSIKELKSGIDVLSQSLEEYFVDNVKVQIVSPEEVESLSTTYNSTPYLESLRIGKNLNAEAVMVWVLKQYRERQGTDYAATSPASVAFEYRLIHTESGKTLCVGSFSETQQSATENLLSLKKLSGRGFKWITASDLIREGVAKKLSGCSYLK